MLSLILFCLLLVNINELAPEVDRTEQPVTSFMICQYKTDLEECLLISEVGGELAPDNYSATADRLAIKVWKTEYG